MHRLVVFAIILMLSSCVVIRETSDFENLKKGIDSLTILPPLISVKSIDVGTVVKYDTLLNYKLNYFITQNISDLLDSKYNISILEGFSNEYDIVDSLYNDQGISLVMDIGGSEEGLDSIELPSSIKKMVLNSKTQYCLLSGFFGYYKTNERKYEEERRLFKINIIISGISFGTVLLRPSKPAESRFYAILIDKINNRVVYYVTPVPSGDPRSEKVVKGLIYKNLKDLYYK